MIKRKMTEEHKRKIGLANKGKKHSIETREKISKILTGRKLSEQHIKKLIGKKHTKETRDKISKTLKGRPGRPHTEETKNKIREFQLGNKRGPHLQKTIDKIILSKKKNPYKHSNKIRKKLRLSAIKRIERQKLNGERLTPTIGKNETKILNNIEKIMGFKIKRQKMIDGYFIDGYNKKNNIVFEINESHHFKNNNYTRKHLERKKYLMNILGKDCIWIDIKDNGDY